MWHWIKFCFSASYRETARARAEHRRRALFRFFDGHDWAYRDPLVVEERLHEHPEFSFERDTQLMEHGDIPAMERTIDASFFAFEVTPYDAATGRGLTRLEMLMVVGQYADFVIELKKNMGVLSMPPPVMESTPTESTEATTPRLSP